MDIRLYDSYSRSMRRFEPLHGNIVRMYACGPTVYNYAHIGNLRTYIFEDILRRVLEDRGYEVVHVVNITDVGHLTSDADTGEDKIEEGSRRTGKSAWEIAEIYTESFKDDLGHLNILEPVTWCRATEHIGEQIADIEIIERNGFTYITTDGVYFDTSKLVSYGHLARLDIDGLEAGQRVDLGEKKNSTDFALWKFSPEGQVRQMEWDSPWGRGFPGWHIECSAMAVKYLGPMFDIHCGGKDHIPVHHSNEIAQSEASRGTRLANFWLHGYFLETDKDKMSKSSREFLRLQTLIDRGYDPLSYRYLCLTASYRSDLKFTWDSLDSASIALNRLRSAVYSWGEPGDADATYREKFRTELYDDLNTPKGLALVWSVMKSDLAGEINKSTILELDSVLGLNLENWEPAEQMIPEAVQALVDARTEARIEKNWVLADELRAKISELGYEIEDTSNGAIVHKK
jgi:cysteinyl-tRNA synthetase